MIDKETATIVVDPAAPEAAAIVRAAEIIRAGGLVAFPTETVYGLGANALDAAAVESIFAAKQRPAHDPLIVHVASVTWLDQLAAEIPPLAYELAARFWPGPLTLVLKRTAAVPNAVTAGGDTVAVRAPNHPIAQALLEAAQMPIAAPSANRFGHTSPTTAQHVLDDLDGRIDLLLDGGATTIGVESTVLDLTATPPTILRHGGITTEALREAIGAVADGTNTVGEGMLASPGLLDRHYAPRTPLVLYRGSEALSLMIAIAAQMQRDGIRPCVLAFDDDLLELHAQEIATVSLGSEAELEQVAHNLYAALRSADGSGADVLLVREPGGEGLGAALRDRLKRAAETVVDTDNL